MKNDAISNQINGPENHPPKGHGKPLWNNSVERSESHPVEQLKSNACLNVGISDSSPMFAIDMQEQSGCITPMSKSAVRKALAAPILQRVVEEVARERALAWAEMFHRTRDTPEHARARVLAMAVACAAGVPAYMVAKVFARKWQTVDSARKSQIELCRMDHATCDEFIRILSRVLQPERREA
jgi:hypothetical protein